VLNIVRAETSEQIVAVRELFLEYARSLSFSLCFQSFDREVAGLPGDYAPPRGRLLLATVHDTPAGCVALHPLEVGIAIIGRHCEMKRLYVRPEFRGVGAGRKLAEAVIAEARLIGYSYMRLDTIEPMMQRAVILYRALGFREIPPYRANPIPGALYMELKL
jgi:ribosomal protein S18 acetylase RimI-like enzyme